VELRPTLEPRVEIWCGLIWAAPGVWCMRDSGLKGMSVSDEQIETSDRCAWCDGQLPAPDHIQAIVHPADGTVIQTCSAACLAEVLRQGTDGLRRNGQAPQDREV
jgi:hypothetical protein